MLSRLAYSKRNFLSAIFGAVLCVSTSACNVTIVPTPGTRLAAQTPTEDSEFGSTVALAGDTIAVATPFDANGKGSVVIFRLVGETWQQTQRFEPAANDNCEGFGNSLA